jgi:hypothetical protein
MTFAELQAELCAILAAEELSRIDWEAVQKRCLQVIERLNVEAEPDYPHDLVYHFLDDVDIRQKDPLYAARQREQLGNWLAAIT